MVFGRRYRATEKIGSGGMADVYKAVDEVLGRTVAVKVLHARYAADPTFAARFRQEAQAAANLQSPYIVNIYDWGQDGDVYYIVMELVRGTDLKTIIQQRGPQDSQRVAEIGAQVCSALIAAHGYDVIHRDIKPHNIMLTGDGSVKVMDFGIARAGNTTMTQTGSVLGTAHYVSPEQAQGRTLSAASDLYSLGVVLYEASTGRLPFDAETPVAVALKQVNEQPRRPRELRPDIDTNLEAVILKAMAKSPAARYESAGEMRRDLLSVVQGRDVTAVAPVAAAAAVGAASETAVMPPVGGSAYDTEAPVAARRVPVKRKRPVWPWVLLAALLIAAGLGIAWYMDLLGTQGVPVPNVIGKTQAEAEVAIVEAGFVLGEVTPRFSPEPEGTVLEQSPLANATAEKGSAVELIVSRGQEMVEVPTLIGLSETEAKELLEDAGLTGNALPAEYSSEFEFGQVTRQAPEPGEKVVKGSSVDYVTSRGVEVSGVPNVVGMGRTKAEQTLREAGFKVSVKTAFNSQVAEGTVSSQNPSAGIRAEKGSTVTIVVSRGPEKVAVPDVINLSEADAKAKIAEAGLKAVVVYEMHSGEGNVIAQSPSPDTMLDRNSTVTITVDGGEEP